MTATPPRPGPRDWKCDYNPAGTEVHVRPRGDHIYHQADDDCLCGPTSTYLDIDAPAHWIVIHHALDGREHQPGRYTPTPGPCTTGDDDGDHYAAACP